MATTKRKQIKTPPPKALKDEVVRMRITREQKAALVAAASGDGLELSAWLRRVALRAAGLLPGGKGD